MGRDGILPFSKVLATFSERLHIPPYALLTAAVFPALIIVGSVVAEDAIVAIVSFEPIGICIRCQMVVSAALRHASTAGSELASSGLGGWGLLVNLLALLWGVVAIVDIAWPRSPGAPWYLDYIALLSTAIVIGIGAIYIVVQKSYLKGDATACFASNATTEPDADPKQRDSAPVL